MDIIMILNILTTLIISTLYISLYQKRAIKMVEYIYNNIGSSEENVTEKIYITQTHIIATTWFIIICGITLTIGFTALFIFQSKSSCFSPYIQTFISSGLYVPIFLFIIGLIISLLYKVYTKISNNLSLSPLEMKTIVFIMAIIINITLIMLDWQIGLFVAAIIIGKFVWIDFVFDTKSFITVVLDTFKVEEEIGAKSLCSLYAKNFYATFLVPTITYKLFIKNIPDISTKIYCMVMIYVVVISMCANYIHGVDIANASFIKNYKFKK
ncbi:MAG: hypothetical protein HDR13_00770 [Lachnospiraceae bacterium]|nr:hypothetical protein [Lachnospiraceae bacterium]